MGKVTMITDGLKNLVSRLGTDLDKQAATRYTYNQLTVGDLENAYRGAWLPRKIIDIPAFDSVRRWRDWQADAEDIAKIQEEERRLDVKRKVLEAQIRARLFGGAAIYIAANDQDPSLPLRVDSVRRRGLNYLTVLPRTEVSAHSVETNPLSENYGKAAMYSLGDGIKVHPSRLAVFTGNELPLENTQDVMARTWGDSVLQAVYDQVRQSDSASANIASLVFEAKVDVFKIPGFMRNLSADDYQQKVQERVRLANVAKGNLAALLMDSEEEYEQKQLNFSGLTDVLMAFVQLCAGAADIPVTRLLGQAPAGMNATGESDLKNYYDRVSSIQEIDLQPSMYMLDQCIVRSALGAAPEDIDYVWGSLWQMTETQRSENAKRSSETIKTLAETGLLPDEALSEAAMTFMSENGSMPGLESAMTNYRETAGQRDLEGEEGEDDLDAVTFRQQDARFQDGEPRTLYVYRKVLNAEQILGWARQQGIENLLDAEDLHVTIAYSRTPVNWMAISENFTEDIDGTMTIGPGGPRECDAFGPNKDILAIAFRSEWLSWRHSEIREMGASWDWPEYHPHITIAKSFSGNAIDIEPYRGPIRLGPEIFEEVDES